ncbi:Rho termination factor N-terminal domain-containing protein [Enterococcus faecalis]|uniref:Rho termination factor N-terminal domain-containing protein n=1 Tax=Enterococcus faecalis TaxID=1351 RepID=UPI0025AF9766|nr:Rho termination factor N-terminal domain-containing protein [Enterococcus faecalis]MDN3089094.1 Rho termination factor N-terminal domain-containing protein [Enterococcus faecalis]
MRVLIRSSASGKEYWDTEEKRNVFVPKGQEPDFEFSDESVSMIDNKIISVDKSEGNDQTVVVVAEKQDDGALQVNSIDVVPSDDESVVLEEMSVKELREYAKRNDIEIPSAVRVKAEILNIIKESE